MTSSRTSGSTAALVRGAMLPSASLRAAPDGRETDLRAGSGARVVVIVHSADCARCRNFVQSLASISDEIADWGGRILVLVPGDLGAAARFAESAADVEVLADSEGILDIEGGTVIVADEWGEIYFAAEAGQQHDFPATSEIVEWIRFIAIQCPECEGPEGEWRTL